MVEHLTPFYIFNYINVERHNQGGKHMTLSDARKRANLKYLKNNPNKRRTYQYRSNAKTFIKKHATIDDLNELEKLIHIRREELSKQ